MAKGYDLIEGFDYFNSLFPVAKLVTVRLFMAKRLRYPIYFLLMTLWCFANLLRIS